MLLVFKSAYDDNDLDVNKNDNDYGYSYKDVIIYITENITVDNNKCVIIIMPLMMMIISIISVITIIQITSVNKYKKKKKTPAYTRILKTILVYEQKNEIKMHTNFFPS